MSGPTNVHGTTLPEPFKGSARPVDVGGWRAPELEGRREQTFLDDNGERLGGSGWRDHPLGHLDPYAYPFRTCWYCGSIHPDDLLALMADHPITLGEADWKYGWPHKFYVDGIPNPIAGREVCSMRRSGGGLDSMDPANHGLGPASATTHAKFYTEHIADSSDLDALAAALSLRVPNIRWERDADGRVKWAGHRGSGVR